MVQFGWRQQPPFSMRFGDRANVLLYYHVNLVAGAVLSTANVRPQWTLARNLDLPHEIEFGLGGILTHDLP